MTDLSKPELEGVLVYPVKGRKILLAEKTRKIGVGKRSGFGGSLEGNETLIECCCRETPEESGLAIIPAGLVKMAEVLFHNARKDGSRYDFYVHVFFAHQFSGTPRDGDGMKDPRWHNQGRMPWKQMIVGDRYWLPPVIAGKKITAEIWYGPCEGKVIKGPVIKEVQSFND
jgi:ADP-ribose pyrophosphatase YjhB (NUDIX family)